MSCGIEGEKNNHDLLGDQIKDSDDSDDVDDRDITPAYILHDPVHRGDSDCEHREELEQITDRNLLQWTFWRNNVDEIIGFNNKTGYAFRHFQCMQTIGNMVKSATNIYFRLVIQHLRHYVTEPQTTIYTMIKKFIDDCLEIVLTENVKKFYQLAKDCGLIGNTDKDQNRFGMFALLEKIYTREVDVQARAILQNNCMKSSRYRSITTMFTYPLSICLTNKIVVTSAFILTYYKFIIDILEVIPWERFESPHIIQSVVFEEVSWLLYELGQPPFSRETAFVKEIKSIPTASPPTPVSQEQPGTGCIMQ